MDVVELPSGSRVVSVACGLHHAVALTEAGELWGWGVNDGGRISTTKNGVVTSAKAHDRGTFFSPIRLRTELGPVAPTARLMCGELHSMLCQRVVMEGLACESVVSIAAWGDNRHGVLGVPGGTATTCESDAVFTNTAVLRVSCGQAHVEVKLSTETLTWGKCPHLLIESATVPVSLNKYWRAYEISNAPTLDALWDAAVVYHEQYGIDSFGGRLNLSGLGLHFIPEEYFLFANIEELDLAGNSFVCSPAELRKFPRLKTVLDASGTMSIRQALAELRDVERQRSVWAQLAVSFHCSSAARDFFRILTGGLAGDLSAGAAETVSVRQWSVSEEHIDVRALVHHPGTDSRAEAARRWLLPACSVQVLVLHDVALEVAAARANDFRAWLEACLGPGVPFVVVVDCSDQSATADARLALPDVPAWVPVLHVDSSSGLGFPQLVQLIAQVGRDTRRVLFPVPRPMGVLCEALHKYWAAGNHECSHFEQLCATCNVADAKEARAFLCDHGELVAYGGMLFDPAWLGAHMEAIADGVYETYPARSRDEALHLGQAKHVATYEFVGPTVLPASVLVPTLARLFGDAARPWQRGLLISGQDEVVQVTLHESGAQFTVVAQSDSLFAPAALYPRVSSEIDALLRAYFAGASSTSSLVHCLLDCPTCRVERRMPVGRIAFAECVRCFQLGRSVVSCGRHELPLISVAPDIRTRFTPAVERDDLVTVGKSTAGRSITTAHWMQAPQPGAAATARVVSVFSLDMDRRMRYGRTGHGSDPWQTLYLLSKLRHPNVVHVLGVMSEGPTQSVVVSRVGLDLDTLNKGLATAAEPPSFPAELQLRIASDVARAMAFLHAHDIVHDALRPANVFLDTLTVREGASVARVHLPVDAVDDGESWRFRPPEHLSSSETPFPSVASDVYAYGMLLYMLAVRGVFATWKLPFGRKATTSDWRKEEKIEKICEQNLRPTMPSLSDQVLYNVACRCWERDPPARGTFVEIVAQLGDASSIQQQQLSLASVSSSAVTERCTGSTKVLFDAKQPIMSLAVVCGRFVWLSVSGGSLVVYDAQTDAQVAAVDAPLMQCLQWIPLTDSVWGGGMDGTVFLFGGCSTGQPVLKCSSRAHNNAITALVGFGDGVVSADLTGDVLLWRSGRASLTKVATLRSFGNPVRCVQVRDALVYVGLSTSVVVLGPSDWSRDVAVFTAPAPAGTTVSMLLHRDELWLVSGSTVNVFRISDRALLAEQRSVIKTKAVALVRLGSAQLRPCTVTVDGTLHVWDADAKQSTAAISESLAGKFNQSTFYSMACASWSPSSFIIARESNLVAWDIKTRRRTQ